MKYILGIPFVNRPDLLERAIQSVRPLWQHTIIIDNSDTGLDPSKWPVPVVRPPVPLTFSQTMNLLQRLAAERTCDCLLFMHNDAEAGPGTPEHLLTITEQAMASGRCWGVVFTHYDALAAFSMAMARDVGPWDTTLPQYFADNDYYRRVRLAGYETIETDLEVIHHNNASNTVKGDQRLSFLNSVTYPLYERYYSVKWGGPPGCEAYDWPFDGAPSILFINYLRNQKLYRHLASSYETVEGNLLERADERTTASQIEAVRHAVKITRPQVILETGTAKSMFGYVLSHLLDGVTLYTFDGDPRCIPGVTLLNTAQHNVKAEFIFGDTKHTLATFNVVGISLAWIDGGHDEATARSDIQNAMRLRIPLIMCDDARTMPEVACAIDRALEANSAYKRLTNPFFNHDSRGIVFLHRKEQPR